MAIKEENKRITITLSNEDLDILNKYANVLNINTARLINKIIHMYCAVELKTKINWKTIEIKQDKK